MPPCRGRELNAAGASGRMLRWLTAEEWLHEHPDDPDAEELRSRVEQDRERHLRWQRDLLGWTIIVGRKR
jgi:hypothetical protein